MPRKGFPRSLLLTLAILLIAVMSGYWFARSRAAATGNLATIRSLNVSQDDDEQQANDVSPAQVEQYVKVYESMQRDRNLTVDQATARQHLTVDQFRDIEGKIERDGVLRERVRRELLKMAQQKSNALKLKPQSAPSSTER
jgi:type III secretory pathway component EscV